MRESVIWHPRVSPQGDNSDKPTNHLGLLKRPYAAIYASIAKNIATLLMDVITIGTSFADKKLETSL